MMLDEAILEELKLNGAGTVRDIRDRLRTVSMRP
jgi:hypothetical protein